MGPYDFDDAASSPYSRSDTDYQPPRTIKIVDKRPAATEHANFTGEYPEAPVRAVVRNAISLGVNPYTALAVSMQENTIGRGQQGISWGAWHTPQSVYENKTLRDKALDLYAKKQELQRVTGGATESLDSSLEKLRNEIYDAAIEAMGEGGSVHRVESGSKYFFSNPFIQPMIGEYEFLGKQRDDLEKQLRNNPDVLEHDAFYFINALKEKMDYGKKVYGSGAPEERILQAYNGYGKVKSGSDPNKTIDAAKELPYGRRVKALRDYTISNNPYLQQIVAEESRSILGTR